MSKSRVPLASSDYSLKIVTVGAKVLHRGYLGDIRGLGILPPIMENQADNMENELDTGIIHGFMGIITNIMVLGLSYHYGLGYLNRHQQSSLNPKGYWLSLLP